MILTLSYDSNFDSSEIPLRDVSLAVLLEAAGKSLN
jgi:hypothetical protein